MSPIEVVLFPGGGTRFALRQNHSAQLRDFSISKKKRGIVSCVNVNNFFLLVINYAPEKVMKLPIVVFSATRSFISSSIRKVKFHLQIDLRNACMLAINKVGTIFPKRLRLQIVLFSSSLTISTSPPTIRAGLLNAAISKLIELKLIFGKDYFEYCVLSQIFFEPLFI